MAFVDRNLICMDCGAEFVFTAGEQLFFQPRQFVNDPKRCKQCKAKRNKGTRLQIETRVECSQCGAETTVPFKPTHGTPVLRRSCFQQGALAFSRLCTDSLRLTPRSPAPLSATPRARSNSIRL
jgi:CxxC-x17-CxxC domain-containing protein